MGSIARAAIRTFPCPSMRSTLPPKGTIASPSLHRTTDLLFFLSGHLRRSLSSCSFHRSNKRLNRRRKLSKSPLFLFNIFQRLSFAQATRSESRSSFILRLAIPQWTDPWPMATRGMLTRTPSDSDSNLSATSEPPPLHLQIRSREGLAT